MATPLSLHPPAPAGTANARFVRLCRAMSAFCLVLIVALPAALAAFLTFADSTALASAAHLGVDKVAAPIAPWQRAAMTLVSEIELGFLLLGLWQARKCFALFARGRVFTADAVRYLRAFAGWTAVAAAASIVLPPVNSVILTWLNGPGQRHLAIGAGSDQFLMLLFAGIVWVMAGVIGQGQALADENAQFI